MMLTIPILSIFKVLLLNQDKNDSSEKHQKYPFMFYHLVD